MKTSRFTRTARAVVGVMAAFSIASSVFAQGGSNFTAQPLQADTVDIAAKSEVAEQVARIQSDVASADQLVSVVVKLDDASLAAYTGGVNDIPATSPSVTGATELDVNSAASQLYLSYLAEQMDTLSADVTSKAPNAVITHRFDVVIGGVGMVLPASQLDALANQPGVQAVYLDDVRQLDSYRSPTFIGAPTAWAQLGGQGSAGEGVVVGILDSGIWPENPAFSDPDPLGKPMPAPPGGPYACQFSGGVNPGAPFTCNNKLIGAYRFMTTYASVNPIRPYEFTSARDDDGHGSHTASTAAGNRGVQTVINGNTLTLSGIAPRAHIIAYKICGEVGCYGSDSAAAIQQSILNGVDVLNYSISGGANPYGDVVALAFLDAYNAGVFVAASAGNSGPTPETVNHRGPWITTVAASTQDRSFLSTATITKGANTLIVTGVSSGAGISTPAEVVANPTDLLCQTPAAPGSFAGKIVMCNRGVNARVDKSANVAAGGAVGMFLLNTTITSQDADTHVIPTIHLQPAEGTALRNFITANPGATATFTPGAQAPYQGDVVEGFSSRGGPAQTLGVSKPDIAAPGVNILAGYTGLRYGAAFNLQQFLSGTSMASPHIAGSGALMKAIHPDWTPGQIKSALMTTAKNSMVKEDRVTPANAFDMGTGRVDLRKSWDPGLTFDETGANYIALRNELWKANYPSVYVPVMPGLVTVQRTAKEVTGYDSHYVSKIEYPAGQPSDFRVIVPRELLIHANGTATFDITVDARDVPTGQVRFATIVLREKNFGCIVRLPVTIVRRQPAVTMTKSCAASTLKNGDTMNCSITMTNGTFDNANVNMVDNLPRQLTLVPGSVVNGTENSASQLSYVGPLAGAAPPNVTIAANPGGSPAGYLPLSLFGIAPVAGVGDDTVTNFNVPAFRFAGETYTRIGFGSNGVVIVGGSTGATDATPANQSFPNAVLPNNVLAPFWTDLNPAAGGGALRIGTLTDGVDTWLVMDWNNIREFSLNRRHSFEVWIRLGTVEDVTFTYGLVGGNGDLGQATVGAENRFGNRGQNYYFNGAGTLPVAGTELRVTGAPGAPGETRTVTFTVKGVRVGKWVNYAEMNGDIWFGTNIARFAGEVTP